MNSEPGRRAAVSWSGGKDSCLAAYRALKAGYRLETLMNMVSGEAGQCCFHCVDGGLIRLQGERMGIPVVQRGMSDDMARYEEEFKAALRGLDGIETMVFGDIFLDEHKDWVERVCKSAGVRAIEPLWHGDTAKLGAEFIDLGFKALVVTCQAEKLGKEFAGRIYDHQMMKECVDRGVCPCGENGEFHTVVIDGPTFSRPIEILRTEVTLRDGFWKHWHCDVKEFR